MNGHRLAWRNTLGRYVGPENLRYPPATPDGPCPECADGTVLRADRPDPDTGHVAAWCDRECGWTA